MIICVCNELNCKKVRAAVAAGARSPDDVQGQYGCSFNCGQCRCMIGEIISEETANAAPAPQLVAAE